MKVQARHEFALKSKPQKVFGNKAPVARPWVHRLRLKRGILLAALAGMLSACADVPEQAVTLSLTVQRDIGELERANVALAHQYFGQMKEQINRFIDDVYAPELVIGSLQRNHTVDLVAQRVANREANAALQIMQISVQELTAAVERKRAGLLQPVNANETQVVQAIQDSYARVKSAQAIVSGHLASIRQVQVAQDELLSDVGLEGLRGKFIDTTAGLSDDIGKDLAEAQKINAELPAGQQREDNLNKALDAVEQKIRAWRSNAMTTQKPGG